MPNFKHRIMRPSDIGMPESADYIAGARMARENALLEVREEIAFRERQHAKFRPSKAGNERLAECDCIDSRVHYLMTLKG